MALLQGLALLLLCQSAGELLVRLLSLRLPGPVVGLALVWLLLAWPAARERIAPSLGVAADALLAHLSLLFVPLGVGVIAHLALLGGHAAALAAVVLLSTLVGLVATALVLRFLWREPPSGLGAEVAP
jgi:holin-like protein